MSGYFLWTECERQKVSECFLKNALISLVSENLLSIPFCSCLTPYDGSIEQAMQLYNIIQSKGKMLEMQNNMLHFMHKSLCSIDMYK